jgi:hypothetical protein
MSNPDERLLEVLRLILPPGMARDLAREEDPEFIASAIVLYLSGDESVRDDMEAIHEDTDVIREEELRAEEGTPTTEDLKEWLEDTE